MTQAPPSVGRSGGIRTPDRRFWRPPVFLLSVLALFLTGCYSLPLPQGLTIQVGDGSKACLDIPNHEPPCPHVEGFYSPELRLALTRAPHVYTITHEYCHAWQHQNILVQRGEDYEASPHLDEWHLTPQGQSFLLMTGYQPRAAYNAVEDAANVCAYRLLGLPMDGLDAGRKEWAEAWIR